MLADAHLTRWEGKGGRGKAGGLGGLEGYGVGGRSVEIGKWVKKARKIHQRDVRGWRKSGKTI